MPGFLPLVVLALAQGRVRRKSLRESPKEATPGGGARVQRIVSGQPSVSIGLIFRIRDSSCLNGRNKCCAIPTILLAICVPGPAISGFFARFRDTRLASTMCKYDFSLSQPFWPWNLLISRLHVSALKW